jgi:glyoxylase-like metal-dependent hydrolase (beta-lactamase superfamily II)
MKIFTILAENFKLDGGACFGVVPKSIWSKKQVANENNMVPCTLRNLLVEDDERVIIFDTGMGNKQSEKFQQNFYRTHPDRLIQSIQQAGYTPQQVTDVVFTHLHFDHCGGAFIRNNEENVVPVFPNANYWSSRAQWEWAINPNPREKASYLDENLNPIKHSGKLLFIENEIQFSNNIFLKLVNGHTAGQLIPIINFNKKNIAFMADFIPTAAHIPIPYIASFDTNPLVTMEEKKIFLDVALRDQYILVFQHDSVVEACNLTRDEKGIKANVTGILSDFIN